MVLLIGLASSQLELTPNQKLKSYADANFKDEINYKTISIGKIEEDGNIRIIHLTIDGKDIRWLTSIDNYNTITNEK